LLEAAVGAPVGSVDFCGTCDQLIQAWLPCLGWLQHLQMTTPAMGRGAMRQRLSTRPSLRTSRTGCLRPRWATRSAKPC